MHKRFKELIFSAIIIITKKRYTIKNARRKRKFIKYIHVIIRVVKAAKIIIHAQIFFFYNNLKLEFRCDLTKLTNNITIKTFLQNIKNNKKI